MRRAAGVLLGFGAGLLLMSSPAGSQDCADDCAPPPGATAVDTAMSAELPADGVLRQAETGSSTAPLGVGAGLLAVGGTLTVISRRRLADVLPAGQPVEDAGVATRLVLSGEHAQQ